MVRLSTLVLLFASLIGCAAKKPVTMTLPAHCILGAVVNKVTCHPEADYFVCDQVAIIKTACA
jgi:hypothetical protein